MRCASTTRSRWRGHDIKLGRGGIREIEFFVQTQQLVFGGCRPALGAGAPSRCWPSFTTKAGSPQARDELSGAYRFFRTIEHRLQMVADEQTQRLPSGGDDLKRFAKFCGYANLKAFEKRSAARPASCSATTRCCSRRDRNLPPTSAASCSPEPPTTRDAFDPAPPRLSEPGGRRRDGARLAFRPPAGDPERARAREVLTELVPALLAALGGTADPDAALAALDRAFGRMPAAVELLTILQSHDRLRLLFADLLERRRVSPTRSRRRCTCSTR